MSQQELFAVLMKAMGVLEFVGGIVAAPQYMRIYSRPGSFPGGQLPVADILWALGVPGLKILAGVILFLGANYVARKVYPEKAQPAP